MCNYDFLSTCWILANSEVESFFGFSDFMSALALIFVMYTITDYRYKIKVNIYKKNLQTIAYWAIIFIGFGLLIGDIWVHLKFIVPSWFPSYYFWQAILSLFFIVIVFWWVYVAFIAKSVYTISNHLKVLNEYKSIITGRDSNLKSIAINELENIIQNIIRSTSKRVIIDDGRIRTSIFKKQQIINKKLLIVRNKKIIGGVANIFFKKNRKSINKFIKEHDLKRESSLEIIQLLSRNESCKFLSESSSILLKKIMDALSSLNNFDRYIIPNFFKQLSTSLISNNQSHLYSSNKPSYAGMKVDNNSINYLVYSQYNIIERFSLAGNSPFDIDLFSQKTLNVEAYRKFCESIVCTFLVCQSDKSFDFKVPSFLESAHSTIRIHLYSQINKSNEESFHDIYASDFYNHLLITANFANGLCSLSYLTRKPRIIDIKRSYKNKNDIFSFVANICYDYILVALDIDSTKENAFHLQHCCITLDTLKSYTNDNKNSYEFISRILQRELYKKVQLLTKGYNKDGILISVFFLQTCLESIDRQNLSALNGNFISLGRSIILWYISNFSSIWNVNPKLAMKLIPNEYEYDPETKVIYKSLIDYKDHLVGSYTLYVN